MKAKILLAIFLVFVLASFVSAIDITPNDPFVKDKMIIDLPELAGYTYRGEWHFQEDTVNYTHIDLRYINLEDNDQHSEFALNIYENILSDSFLDSEINNIRALWNVSIKEINGNKIYEGTSELPTGTSKTRIWISGKNYIRSWNGNDIGSVVDNTLFDVLTLAYLEKYPSTYGCENGICNPQPEEPRVDEQICCSECVRVHSAISGRQTSEQCITLKDVDLSLPYHLSSECKNYFQTNSLTILNCIAVVSLNYTLIESNVTIIYIEPNETSGPIELNYSLENYSVSGEISNKSITILCSGCELDKKCYPFGFRKNGKFCSDENNQFIEQKKTESSCENNFECSSNLCTGNQCISSGLWQKFLNWLKRLFG